MGFWGFLGILETVCTGINMKRDHIQNFRGFSKICKEIEGFKEI